MAVIRGVIETRREKLAGYGWTAEEYFTEEDGRGKSVTQEVAREDLPEDFPVHFPQTRCVFLDTQHRCVLQRLAMDEGLHPWWWKPVSCWMHPLVLVPGLRGGRPVLKVPGLGGDPSARAGYAGFASCTPCGMASAGGPSAAAVLKEELELLGKIGRRDFLGELG